MCVFFCSSSSIEGFISFFIKLVIFVKLILFIKKVFFVISIRNLDTILLTGNAIKERNKLVVFINIKKIGKKMEIILVKGDYREI